MSAHRVPKWEKFETSFVTRQKFDNPFVEVEIKVYFEWSPGASTPGAGVRGTGALTYWIDGFYDGVVDGRQTWRVRFAPMHEGSWTYRVVSTCAELDGQSGSFECVAPVSRGGLTVDSHFPNYFFRSDGAAQFIANEGWTPHPGGGLEEYGNRPFDYPKEDEFMLYLDKLGEYRVNMVIDLKQLYARQRKITDPSYLWPWAIVDQEKNRFDVERFNLAYFRRLDRQLEHALSLDIFYAVETLYDNSIFRTGEFSGHPWNAKNGGWIEERKETEGPTRPHRWYFSQRKLPYEWETARFFDLNNPTHVAHVERYLAYLVARTAAYRNVVYALGSECANIFPDLTDLFNDWFSYWGDFVASRDPHGRLQSFGDVGEKLSMLANNRNAFLITQEHTSMDDFDRFCMFLNGFAERFYSYRRPTLVGEQHLYNNNRYATERVGQWVSFCSGLMMGRVDRHMEIVDNGRLFESTLFKLDGDPPIYADIRRMVEFVEQSGIRFWRMAPHDELIVGQPRMIYCLAEPEQEYLLYFVSGGRISLHVSRGSYRVQWYNPRDGRFGAAEERIIDQTAEFSPPDSDDWVLHLVRSVPGA